MSSLKSEPILTIIIPTFNSEATLEVALKSIINQTFKNFEVLIIDGKSSDDTIKIAEQYQLKFPQIKIISEADKGIYDAMNKGIGLAKGEWVYFMGSDDSLYETTSLEKVFNKKQLKTLDVIYGNVYSSGFNGVYDGEFTYSKMVIKNICHQAIFFRIGTFKKTGNFNLKYKVLADWDHNIKWFFSSKISKLYTNQIIANYSEGGLSALNTDSQFYKDKNLKLLTKGFGKIGISDYISICRNAIRYSDRKNSVLRFLWIIILNTFLLIRRINRYKNPPAE